MNETAAGSDISKKIKEIVYSFVKEEVCPKKPISLEAIKDDSKLEDFEIDSMYRVSLILTLEDELKMRFPTNEKLTGIKTVRDIVSYVNTHEQNYQ